MLRLPPIGPPHRAATGRVRPAWLARGLASAYLFGAGTGRPTDLVTGAPAAPTNAPPWVTAAEGPVTSYTAASSQLHDLGAGAWLLGTPAFTLLVRARRTASLGRISVGNGPTTSLRTGFAAYSDGNLYALAAAGGVSYGSVAHNSTAWHTYAVRFEGAGATNAARLRLFIDGTEQTLAYTGTVPAATHASPATLYAGYFTSAGQYDTAEVGAILGFRTALSADEIATLSREPHAVLEVPRPLWPVTVTGAADVAEISDETPAPDEARAELDGIHARFTAADAGDPVVAVTATLDGDAATVTTDEVSATVTDAEITDELLHGRTYTVVWTVEAESGATETFPAYSFTTRDAEHAPTPISYLAGGTVATGASPVALTVRGSGIVLEEHLELSVQEGTARGAYHSEPLYLIVGEYVLLPHALALAMSAGDLEESDLALAMQVEGSPIVPLPVSLAVTGRVLYDALPVSMDTGEEGFSALPLALSAGDLEESELPVAVDVEATQLPALPAVVVMRNEDRAAEEDE
jgi:hypothetical protein